MLAPWTLPDRERAVWDRTHGDIERLQARELFPEWASPRKIAKKAVKDLFVDGKRRRLPGPKRLPDPGNSIDLGPNGGGLLGLYTVNDQGVVKMRRWKTTGRLPPCLWSKKLKGVVCFPGVQLPAPTMSAYTAPALLELYEEWHDGKEPLGVSRVNVPKAELGPGQPALAIVYRSDKFSDDGDMTDYMHVLGPGVTAWVGKKGILVRGGRLRLTAGGLVG